MKRILQETDNTKLNINGKKKRKLNSNPFEDLPMIMNQSDQPSQQQQQIHNNKKQKNKQQSVSKEKQLKWIIIQKQVLSKPLTVTITDHSKLNTYYSHRSIQKYLRYLVVNTCPNPMWLVIKRQSQVKGIFYVDIQIQSKLFNKMIGNVQKQKIQKKQLDYQMKMINQNSIQNNQQQQSQKVELPFLASLHKPEKIASFKRAPFIRQRLWQYLFCYEQEVSKQQDKNLPTKKKTEQLNTKLTPQLLKIYQSYVLTPTQLKDNLYPVQNLSAYKNYAMSKPKLITKQTLLQEDHEIENKILCVDCQMVITKQGFQLARVTICNYQGKMLYDQFFKPLNEIVNYNTQYSGITYQTLSSVKNTIQNDLHPKLIQLIKPDTILVGHSLENDLHSMKFLHKKVIDTSIVFLRKNGNKMKLKTLAFKILGKKIQQQTHCSLQDCMATLDLLKTKIIHDMQNQLNGSNNRNDIQYHFLKEVEKLPMDKKKSLLVVDHDLDMLRKYTFFKFEKVNENTSPITKSQIILENYLDTKKIENQNQIKPSQQSLIEPSLFFMKMHKNYISEWQQHYHMINVALQKIYQKLKPGTVLFLNFQINQNIKIFSDDLKVSTDRPYCIITAKS